MISNATDLPPASEVWGRNARPYRVDLGAPDAVSELWRRYCNPRSERILDAVVSQAIAAGAKSAILEVEYTDKDFRSEFSAFYASAFSEISSKTHRLHFFADDLPAEFLADDTPGTLDGLEYVGYAILRPVRPAPVGRTMIRPTPVQAENLTCVVRERVGVFGQDFEVEGFPFMAQDANFGVCAHAASWMVAYYHHLRYRTAPRITPAVLVGSSPGAHGPYPQSRAGVTPNELNAMLGRASLPTLVYKVEDFERSAELHPILCRYLDSGIPVILMCGPKGKVGHVVTVIGYRRRGGLRPKIELLVHDDERGVYLQTGDQGIETYRPWRSLVVPIPEKIWTACEIAEMEGQQRAGIELKKTTAGAALAAKMNKRPYRWRTVAVESSEFKVTLTERGMPAPIAVHYRRIPMPRWIWVVELIERNNGTDHVVGELVLDTTSHARDSHVLIWRLADQFFFWHPNESPIPINVDPHARLSPLRARGRGL